MLPALRITNRSRLALGDQLRHQRLSEHEINRVRGFWRVANC